MAKKIEPMTIDLTAEEVLGLRHIHSCWLNRDRGNAPFCEAMSDQFLEKLGGYMQDSVWGHDLAEKWYADHEECCCCGKFLNKEELVEVDEEMICPECVKDNK